MTEHYIVTIDRGRLRIYTEARSFGQRTPRLELVEAMDFPTFSAAIDHAEVGDSSDDGSSSAYRPMSERVSHRGPEARRNTELLAAELDTFLQNRPSADWDFAAAPSIFHAVIGNLSADTRGRLKRVVPKTMVNQRAEEVRAHFAAVGS